MTIAEFNKKQRTNKESGTGATLEFHDGEGTSIPRPKQRPSRSEKKAAKEEVVRRTEERAVLAAQKAATAVAKAESDYLHETVVRCDCGRHFLTGQGLATHGPNRLCVRAKAVAEERRRRRDVRVLLVEAVAKAVRQRAERIKNLRTVTVTLRAPKDKAEVIGIALELDEASGAYLISAVSGLAEASAQVAPGYIVTWFNLGSGIVATSSSSILAGEVGVAMKARFSNELRVDTSTPM